MSSSRHTRRQRQQQSLRRHRMKLERLEKRYALDAAAITDPADWGWAGVVENAKVFSVAQDSTGAVYTAGTFSGTIDLDFSASSSELISVGADDIFVAKYDSGGTFIWAKQLGSTGRDKAYTITIDQSDNLRIGGFFEGSVDFDPGVGTDTLTSAGAGDGYVLSLDADGNYLWAGRFGGVGTGSANGDGDFVNTIAVDGSGNTYVGGVIYQGSGPAVDVQFGTGSTTVTGSGQQNTIIVKIDASGELVWAKHFDSGFLNGPNSLDINTNGDIVIGGGLHSQSMDADPGLGVATLNASGLSDAYIVVLDQDGVYRWAYQYGTAGEESIKGVATDASGNIYVNAGISGSVDLDPGAGEELFAAVGSYDLVIVSFDSDGNYRWSESYGDASAQSGWGMTVNGQNELVVSGLFEGSLTLPAGSSVSAPTSIGGNDHFVLWLNTDNGQALKVTNLGTTSNDAEKIAVWDFGPNGLLVSGWLAGGGDVDFSPDSSGSIIAVPSGGTSYVRRMSAKSPWGYPLKEQPQGNWLHSSGTGPGQSSSWYPTAIPSNESLTQHGYATYWHHTGTPAGWFTQPTFSTNTFFVFETYVTSEITQSIDYLLGGNEGHSLFVNNQFVKGAGFGNDNVSGTLSFQAGVPVKVTLVGYNSGADTHISFRTADLQNIEDIPGVSVSAKLLRVTSSEHAFELDNTKPTITGFGTPGASIEVFADLNRDGTTETSIGTTTVASDNSWSLTSVAWLPGGPVNVSATQNTGDPELSTADGVITVRTNRPGALVEVGADLLADGYINAAEVASNIVLRTPFDGSMISSGNSLWVFTDTGGNRTFALQTVGSTAPGNNYKDVGFSADLLREGPQAIDAWFTPTSSGGKAREVLTVTKDTIAPEATLGISDASIFSNETATVSITLSEDVNGLDVTDFVVSGGTLTSLSGASPNLTATFTPDVDFSGTATISIASDAFTDVAGNPNTASHNVITTVLPEILTTGELSRFEDEGIGGEFGIWTDAIAFAENRIASYVPTGSGFVRTWSLSESNEIVRTGDVFTPNTVASEGFGFSLVLDETILGIGSPQAVVNATHDGQFYLYEPATRASIAALNPQPHVAQYFGASSAISENDYFVVSETGNWDHDTSFGITFYGYDNAGQPTLLFRETIDPVGAPVAQYGGNLAVSGEYVVGGYHLETEKTFSLKVWQVNGSGAEATVSGWAPVEIETIDDFYNGRGEQRLATNGNFIVRSSSLSNVVNIFQIDSVGKTINHVTDIEAPPGVSGFGEAVTFTDNKLFIGAPSATGESYVFIYDVNDSGIQRNSFVSSSSLGASAGSEFGSHIVFDEGKVLIAAGADVIYLGDVARLDGINDLPEIDAIADISINEDSPEQIVSLTGISAAGGEAQPLRVTASSSDTGLIPDPTVTYSSADPAGTLAFTPAADQFGTATITVTVEDGGLDNNLATPGDNATVVRTFTVNVAEVNDDPTLDAISDININEDAGEQTVNLTGIATGGSEVQQLRVTATSDNTGLIPDPTVTYSSADPTGTLAFTPVADQFGTATVTVTVEDGGLDNNLATPGDNATVVRTFTVNVAEVNDDPTLDALSDVNINEDAGEQTVNLTGIATGGSEVQQLRVTATSDNTGLIPDPTVDFDGQSSTGTLKFTPVADQFGTATITVTVEDGGLDNDLATSEDNGVINRTVTVITEAVNDDPTLDGLSDVTINEDDLEQTVNLTGITAGGGETQVLSVTATSDNTGLIPDPTVTFDGQSSTGTLKFTPVADQFGTATITVTVEDGGLDNNLGTPEANATVIRTFTVNVASINEIAPIITAPTAGTATPFGAVSFTEYLGNSISIADLDAGTSPVEITLTADYGTISLKELPDDLAITFVANDGVADSTLTLRGTVDDINTALEWVVYRPANIEENFYQWTVEEGGNGHWYEFVESPLTWDDAQATAVSRGGYLATSTTAEENAVVGNLIPNAAQVWLGGYQDTASPSFSEPGGGWTWVTGEVWNFTDWRSGLPNNSSESQAESVGRDKLAFAYSQWAGPEHWYDWDENFNQSYVIEYESNPSANQSNISESNISITVDDLGGGNPTYSLSSSANIQVTIQSPSTVASPEYPTAASNLDPSFGNGGKATLSLSNSVDYIHEITLQESGKILGVGSKNNHFAIYRLNNDLSLDTTFGANGAVELDFGDGIHAKALEVDESGRVVAVGGNRIVRLNADGSLDTSFGGQGWVTADHVQQAWDIEIRPDGALVVGGGDDSLFRVALWSNDGQRLATKEADHMGYGSDFGRALVGEEDGSVKFYGMARKSWDLNDTRPAWIRLNEFDDYYSRGGINPAFFDFVHSAIALPEGDVLLVGQNDNNQIELSVLSREESRSGHGHSTADSTFGTDGRTVFELGTSAEAYRATVTPDGKILVSGVADIPQQSGGTKKVMVVVRLLADGTPDPLFGENGVTQIEFDGDAHGYAITQLPDGKIVVAGRVGDDVALVRLLGDSPNASPTLDALSPITINEDASEQTINLAGITTGGGETQVLSVTATSNNPGLIPDPTVIYPGADWMNNGLLAHYPLDGDAKDASGNGNDGTTDGVLLTQNRFGQSEKAYDFDGVDDSIDVGSALGNFGTSPLTLSAWIKTDTDTGADVILSQGTYGSGTSQFYFRVNEDPVDPVDQKTVELFLDDGTTRQSIISTSRIEAGRWYHVVGQRDDVGMKIYIDGQLDNANSSSPINVDSSDSLELGVADSWYNMRMDGAIDDVRIYDRALTANEVESLYALNMGTLQFTPVANQNGTATITVTVEDGGFDNDLSTTSDNATTSQTFDVTVNPVNDAPVLGELSDVNINEDDPEQTVNLTGIAAGGGETQVLSVTATSDNTGLIPDPTVDFDGQSSTGTLKFTPVADQFGTATITITVEDGGLDNDLGTPDDNGSILRTVIVKAYPVNDAPVLDSSATSQFDSVVEDAGAPVGQVGTLVSALIDAGGTHDNFSDVDGDLPGIAITGVNLQGGTLYYSIDNGTTWSNVGAVSGNSARVLHANSDTRLAFVPAANFHGSISDVLTFKAWDRTGGYLNGGVTNVFNSQIIGSFDTNPAGQDKAIALTATPNGQTVIVGDDDGGTWLIDVQDPTNPVTLRHVSDDVDFYEYVVSPDGNTLYGTNRAIDISNVSSPNIISTWDAGNGFGVAVSNDGNTLYVADWDTGIRLIDVSDQHNPSSIGVTNTPGGAHSLVLSTSGDTAYVADGDAGLQVLSFNSPNTLPSIIGSVSTPGDAQGVDIASDGAFAVVADGSGGLQIVDLTTPTNPIIIGSVPTSSARHVKLSSDNNSVYVADGDDGLYIIDVTDRTAPTIIATQDFGGSGASSKIVLSANEKIAYVAGRGGFHVVDVSPSADSLSVNSDTISIEVTPVNDEPTLDALSEVTINEDDLEQTINLTGITAGGGETQVLSVAAVSDNSGLIPDPTVTYSSADPTGTLAFTPVADQFGTATITVTVEDGGLDNDLATTEDNGVINRTVFIAVAPVNDDPTLDELSESTLIEDFGTSTVQLTGITAGPNETQDVRVTAVSSDTNLVTIGEVQYPASSWMNTGRVAHYPLNDTSPDQVIDISASDTSIAGLQDATYTFNFKGSYEGHPAVEDPRYGVFATPAVKMSLQTAAGSYGSHTGDRLYFELPDDRRGTELQPWTTEFFFDVRLDGDTWQTMALVTLANNTAALYVDGVKYFPSSTNRDLPGNWAPSSIGTFNGREVSDFRVYNREISLGEVAELHTGVPDVADILLNSVADQHGTATVTVTVEDGGLDNDLATPEDNGSILRTVIVKVDSVNDAPTLDPVTDLVIPEDSSTQFVRLSGVTAGGGETQPLRVTTASSNPSLIRNQSVASFAEFDNETRLLAFSPVVNQYGSATITVTIEDGGLDLDLNTAEDNGTVSRSFDVVVESVNDQPTLNPVSNLVLAEDSLTQVLDITGITAGGSENQPLQVTALSSNPSLVLHPTVTSRAALGSDTRLLTVTPLPDQYGIATVTVTVEDGGLDLDLNTAEDNATFSQTFDVTITPDTDNPPSPVTPHGKMFIHETLSGDSLVSYQLPAVNVNGEAINGLLNRITPTSSDTALIPDPTVLYASADVPSSLSFTPVASANGTATLSIQVEDGGPDNDFATTEDNRQATHQVEVNVLEVISNQGSAILAKDSTENLYVNTQPVVYHEQQAQSTIAGFAAIGATSEGVENALLVQRSSVTTRLVTDDAWRINGLFDSLQNESSPVLDLSAREVSSTLNVVAISGAYEINGVNNPTLIVRRGQTYTLNLNVAGHPFYLQTTGSGYQSANIYSGGFAGNGQTSGEHQWVVPEDAPDEIFYQCEFHPVMFGKIIVID